MFTPYKKLIVVLGLTAFSVAAVPHPAHAQTRGAGRAAPAPRGQAPVVVGRAAPRGPYVAHPGYPPSYYRPGYPYYPYYPYYRPYYPAYYYPGYYYPGWSFGFSIGYGYPGYGYPFAAPYGSYGYASGAAYGGVRIDLPEHDAQVFVDGYYAGVVDNFDGAMQHLDLTPGSHHVEVRADGYQPLTFDVNVQAGNTITYRAEMKQTQQ